MALVDVHLPRCKLATYSETRSRAFLQVWSTNGVEGVHRFLARAWRLFEGGLSEEAPSAEQLRTLHSTIKRVSTWAA